MIDFPIQEGPTLAQCLIVFCYYIVIVKLNYVSNISDFAFHKFTSKQTNIFFVFITIGVVFYMVAGDFWHYQSLVTSRHYLDAPEWNHIEETYTPIIAWVNRNYLLFRIIVWGGASLLTYFCFRLVCRQPYHALFILFSCHLSGFAYGRASLALSFYFLGIAVMVTENFRYKSFRYIVGLSFIGISYYFHHSLLMLILVTPIIFIPLNKFTIILLIVSIPLVASMLGSLIPIMANNDVLEEEGIAERLLDITETSDYSGFKLFQRTYSYSTILVSAFVFVREHIKKRTHRLPSAYKAMNKIMCGIIVVAFCTLIVTPTDLFFFRFLGMTIIPSTVLMCYIHDNALISKKSYKMFWFFNMGNLCITILYKVYAGLVTG